MIKNLAKQYADRIVFVLCVVALCFAAEVVTPRQFVLTFAVVYAYDFAFVRPLRRRIDAADKYMKAMDDGMMSADDMWADKLRAGTAALWAANRIVDCRVARLEEKDRRAAGAAECDCEYATWFETVAVA